MPYARKTRKPRRRVRKRMRRYRKKTARSFTLVRSPNIGGFSKSAFTRLKFTTVCTLNPGVGGTNSVNVFSANSIYDPDRTAVGSSVRGYDQWMTLYNHWYVKRSRIVVEIHQGDATYEILAGVATRDTTSTETNPLDYAEQDSSAKLIGRVGSSHNHMTFRRGWTWKNQLGVPYTNAGNRGLISSNPQEESFYHVWAGQPFGNDSSNAYAYVTIYYDVLFTELKDLGSS